MLNSILEIEKEDITNCSVRDTLFNDDNPFNSHNYVNSQSIFSIPKSNFNWPIATTSIFHWDSVSYSYSTLQFNMAIPFAYINTSYQFEDHIDMKSFQKILTYQNKSEIESFLGISGMKLLSDINMIIQQILSENNWNPSKILVEFTHDSEWEEWKYILITGCFNIEFDQIEQYFNQLYAKLDSFICNLPDDEKDTMIRKFYFNASSTI